MKFEAKIINGAIEAYLVPSCDLESPTLCFSCLIPQLVIEGGILTKSLGGYSEVRLPPLKTEQVHRLVLLPKSAEFTPKNRAWLPLAPYLREGEKFYKLPDLPAGPSKNFFKKTSTSKKHTPDSSELWLIPQPQKWYPDERKFSSIRLKSSHPEFLAVDALAKRLGLSPLLCQTGDEPQVEWDQGLNGEAYNLRISENHIRISVSSATGLFYAGITLLSLFNLYGNKLPCGYLKDEPQYEWRGQHLDCARHFYKVETLIELLDLMALLKLNKFHWHFADDEAFRLELKGLPELTQKGAIRGEGQLLPGLFAGGIKSGGSYSPSDVSKILEHAQKLKIGVMPEVELPAHALTLTRLHPETRDPEDLGVEESIQGYRQNVLNPAMPKTWELIEKILKEVSDIFPFPYLHLGCDELPKGVWSASPAARRLMRQYQIEDSLDLQAWFMKKVGDKVRNLGKKPAAWEEARLGKPNGIEPKALLFFWTGENKKTSDEVEPYEKALKTGYDVVLTPAHHLYFDMAHTDAADDWGATWAATIGLEDTLGWLSPQDQDSEKRRKGKLLGVQGAFWSEFTFKDELMFPMLFPRILGLAAVAWQKETSHLKPHIENLAQKYRTIISVV